MDYYGPVAAEQGITIISAISSLPEARIKTLKKFGETTRVLWSPNITLGINFLVIAAKTLQKIAPLADISILEEHFKGKEEVSGTARKIAQALSYDEKEIRTIRAGGIIGVHEVLFGFPYQTVRIKHESIAREAFGNGAKFALKEVTLQKHGFYNMEELVGRLFVEANQEFVKLELTKERKMRFFQKLRSRFRKR